MSPTCARYSVSPSRPATVAVVPIPRYSKCCAAYEWICVLAFFVAVLIASTNASASSAGDGDPVGADLGQDRVDGHGAGDFARRRSAHAVGDHEQRTLWTGALRSRRRRQRRIVRRQVDDEIGVLVVLTSPPHICLAEHMHDDSSTNRVGVRHHREGDRGRYGGDIGRGGAVRVDDGGQRGGRARLSPRPHRRRRRPTGEVSGRVYMAGEYRPTGRAWSINCTAACCTTS